MDMIHVTVILEDQFSGCTDKKMTTVSKPTFDNMVRGIGTSFSHFDKKDQIRYNWKVISVKQTVETDYKN